jgi:hypothetical protein
MRRKAIFPLEWRTWRCRRLLTSCWALTRRGEKLRRRLELALNEQ